MDRKERRLERRKMREGEVTGGELDEEVAWGMMDNYYILYSNWVSCTIIVGNGMDREWMRRRRRMKSVESGWSMGKSFCKCEEEEDEDECKLEAEVLLLFRVRILANGGLIGVEKKKVNNDDRNYSINRFIRHAKKKGLLFIVNFWYY